MMLTKGAIGNLINRYSAVLKKCSLMNTFGSLAVAGMLVVGSVAAAGAAASIGETQYRTLKDAVKQATSGATITLTEGELEAGGISYETGKDLVIDLNNNIYKATNDAAGSSGTKSQIFQLLKNSNITIKNGSITAKDGVPFFMGLQNYSNLTLDNVILQGTETIQYLLSNNYGDINIKNSTIDADAKQVAFDVYYWPVGGYKEGVAVAIEDSIINGRIVVNTDKTAAIGNNKHSLTMTNCTLGGGLTAESDGGQLYTAGTTTISNVAFNQNKATNGGAIYNTVEKTSAGTISGRGILNLNNTTFTNNTAITNGGAIYNAGTVVFTGTNVFTGNTAAGAANDIYNATGGTVTIAEGTTTLNRGIVTAGTVNVTGGNLTVASLNQTDGLLTIGGSTNKAQLTVSGAFVNKKYSQGTAGVDVQNLGTLSVKSDVVTKGTGTTYALNADANQINVAAGGTVKLGFGSGTELTTENLGEIKKALATNFAGLLDVGNATIQNVSSGTASYSNVAGVTNESLKDTMVTATAANASDGISGGFKEVRVDSTGTSDVKVTKTLVLAGSSTGGNLLQNSNNTVLGATVADNSALTLGVEDKANSGTVGAVSLGSSSALNAIGSGSFTVDSITTTGSGGAGIVTASAGGTLKVTGNIGGDNEVKASGGTVQAQAVTTKAVTLDAGGSLTATNLTIDATNGTGITVGNADGAGTLVVTGEANLNGKSLFLDPAWIADTPYQDAASASRAAFASFGTSGVNGLLTVGQNSQLSLGTADVTWLTKSITDMGSSVWGAKGITAALGIYSSQTLASTTGAILVDGSKTSNPTLIANTAAFAANSLLVVYAPNMLTSAALAGSTSSTLTVDADAKLHIMGGKANDTVHIVSGFTASTIGGWSTNLTTDSKLLTANAGTLTSGAYDVTLSQNSTRSIFPKLDKNMAGLVDGMVKQIGLDPMSENYGQRFVSRAVSDSYIGTTNAKKAAATIEGAAKIAFAGAAPQMGMNLANAAGNIAGLRNSLSAAPQGAVVALNADGTSAQEGLSAGDGMKNGLGLWVMPTYQNQQGFGFESGDFETGYKSNAAGVALGADYTFNDMFRVGAQFNVGGGYAESTGDFNSTDNRFNYWGLGLYAGYQYQNFGLTADFGYSANNNELEQSLPSAMQMAKLKADAKTDTITAGLRGEYKITTDALDIVPHLGVRMTNMHMDSFNVKSDKHKVFKADDMNATVWTFPVGVTFSKDIETSNGWTIKPSLDLAIIPAAGDIEAKQDVKIVGVNGTASMESNIMDAISYQGSLGLSAKNDNGVSVGVNYTLQAGAHTTDHGVQATFRYEF